MGDMGNEAAVDAWMNQEFPPDKMLVSRRVELALADRIGFAEMDQPFERTLCLEFDAGMVALKIYPWTNESRPQPHQAVLARIESDPGRVMQKHTSQSRKVVLDGASLGDPVARDDIGVLAWDCNISYRIIKQSLLSARSLNKNSLFCCHKEISLLRELGLVRRIPAGPEILLVPSVQNLITPPVREILQKQYVYRTSEVL